MLNCFDKAESKGRVALLHAVSLVLEYSSFADARTFHNLAVTKIEQERISWSSDFTLLADQYIDRKLRQSLRSRGPNRSSHNNKSYGKSSSSVNSKYGYGGDSKSYASRSRSLSSLICRQWNNDSCSYGDNCKKWHVCWTCAEAGKPGEAHKSSSHENSSSKGKYGPRG